MGSQTANVLLKNIWAAFSEMTSPTNGCLMNRRNTEVMKFDTSLCANVCSKALGNKKI